MKKYAASICVYNFPESVDLCLQSLRSSITPPDKIIVTDSSSNGDIENVCSKHNVELIQGDKGDGYAKSQNKSLNKIIDDFENVLIMTGDIYVLPNATQKLISCPMRYENGCSGRIFNTRDTKTPGLKSFTEPYKTKHFSGNFWMLPCKVLRKLPFIFDESYWSYGEDTDLVHRMGIDQWIIPDAYAIHENYSPFSILPEKKYYFLLKNSLKNAKKYGDWKWFFTLFFGLVVMKPKYFKVYLKSIIQRS